MNIALIKIFTPSLFPLITEIIPTLILSPIVFGTVWTLYFKKSRRVKNTYPDIVGGSPIAIDRETAHTHNEVKDYTK